MTRTEREQRVTRTIETTIFKVWAIDTTDNVTTFEHKAVKADDKRVNKALAVKCENDGLIFVRAKAIATESNLYVTTLDEYMKIAHIETERAGMTREERENRVTRTIETTIFKVWAIDTTDNVTTFEHKAVKADDKCVNKALAVKCENDGLIFVRAKAISTESNLYVTTLDEYMKIAHIENTETGTE